jgi:hypothetical protein
MAEDWALRLADDRTVAITNYVMIEVVVAGIRTIMRAYIMGCNQTFDLLLSKSWMTRVRAIEDHGKKTLTIHSKAGSSATVSADAADPQVHELITDPHEQHEEHDVHMAEDELAKLNEELDEFEFLRAEKASRQ